MFARAADHGTPLFSSSALRFAEELEGLRAEVGGDRIHYFATGGPGAFATYAVHQLEMIVSILGPGARRVVHVGNAEVPLLVIDYGDGRRARLELVAGTPFSAAAQFGAGKGWRAPAIGGGFFPRFMEGVLRFFDTGDAPVSSAETLEVMALIDAGKQALKQPDEWVAVAAR
jgi:predicted dehydrogenase